MLPNDINMLVSFLNTKLRDEIEIMELLDVNGYYFDEKINQIKIK